MGADETDALLSAVQACVEKVNPPALPLSRPPASTPPALLFQPLTLWRVGAPHLLPLGTVCVWERPR